MLFVKFQLFIACFFLLALGGCRWLQDVNFVSADSRQIVHLSDQLTIAWDPPAVNIPGSQSEVAAYRIYYRKHGTAYWRSLDIIEASRHPQYTIKHEILGDGLYEFAISAISVKGGSSPLHSSLDINADPMGGWHVLWLKSE